MEAITGIILAGGKSSRMGTDKGLMHLSGKPMIQHILDPLTKVCKRIIIVTENPLYSMFGFDLVKDEAPNYGPVMGILSGLKQSTTERNVVLSCDAPFVTLELLKQLMLLSDEADVVAAVSEKGIHPLIAVYNKSCIPVFEEEVRNDEHRLRTILKKLDLHKFKIEDEQLVRNLNTQADLEA